MRKRQNALSDGVCIINTKLYICYISDRFHGASWKGSFCLGYPTPFIDISIKNSESVNNATETALVGVTSYHKSISVEIWKIKLTSKAVLI